MFFACNKKSFQANFSKLSEKFTKVYRSNYSKILNAYINYLARYEYLQYFFVTAMCDRQHKLKPRSIEQLV